ncbi:hypothetical protein IG631_08682 [Alternaria alternata]|nr:hypothetical protein IG631_08682 [Alternaria alternata]
MFTLASVAADTTDIITAQLRHLATQQVQLDCLQPTRHTPKPTRSAQTPTTKCLPPQTPSPRPLALSSSLRVASAAASAQTTAVAAAFLALSCKRDSKNISYGGI